MKKRYIITAALLVGIAATAYWGLAPKKSQSPETSIAENPFSYLAGHWHSEKNEDTLIVRADRTCSFKLGEYESNGPVTFRESSSDHSVRFKFEEEPYVLILKRPTKDGKQPKGWTHGMIFNLKDSSSKSGWSPIYQSTLRKQ